VLNESALCIPDSIDPQRIYSLAQKISAVRLIRKNSHIGKLGDISQLPAGARLEDCGAGYNERTLKVRCDGEFYFVFLQDLQALA
jgi:hypothetical protein